jgi:acetyl esterase
VRASDTVGAMIEWVEVPDEAVEEMRAINTMVSQLQAAAPSIDEIGAEATRTARRNGEGWMGPVTYLDHAVSRQVDTEIGPITVRTVVPDQVEAVYLHIHGGGWTLGGADMQDVGLETMAQGANVAVVSVEYRLAPEHPFPAGPDDCEAAALWLIEHAADEFGTDRLIIGGESAGAHLAALTLLRVRDRLGTVDPFVAANLVFGNYDLSLTPSTRNWAEGDLLVLSGPIMRWFGDAFVPDMSLEERRSPSVSPLYANLADLVPALFIVGTADPLLDDSLFMGARWHAAGNAAEVVVYPEAPHGFVALPNTIGRMAVERQIAFVAQHAKG